MELTLKKLATWFIGFLFMLVGFGMLSDSIGAGIITILIGVFLLPKVRQEFSRVFEVDFSTPVIIIILLIGMGAAGSMLPEDSSLENEETTDADQPENNETQQSASNQTNEINNNESLDNSEKIENEEKTPEEVGSMIKSDIENTDLGWSSWVEEIRNVEVERGYFEESDFEGDAVEDSKYDYEDFRVVRMEIVITETGWGDDYLAMMDASSEVFKQSFVHNTVLLVEADVYKQTTDEYGQNKLEYLGYSAMNSQTASKINWENFETDNLDDVAEVQFKGQSTYRDLEDLNKRLEDYNYAYSLY